MYVYIIIIPNETLPSFTNYQLLILSLHGTHLRQTSETKDRHGPCSRELDRCPPSPNPRVLWIEYTSPEWVARNVRIGWSPPVFALCSCCLRTQAFQICSCASSSLAPRRVSSPFPPWCGASRFSLQLWLSPFLSAGKIFRPLASSVSKQQNCCTL